MARIRTIKPEFFTSEDIVALSPLARLLYIALWCEADRSGRMAWKPKTWKLRYLPADDCDMESLSRELIDAGLVRLYGGGLAYIPTFATHQHVNPREAVSVLPAPDDACPTRAPRVTTRDLQSVDDLPGELRGADAGSGHIEVLERWKPAETLEKPDACPTRAPRVPHAQVGREGKGTKDKACAEPPKKPAASAPPPADSLIEYPTKGEGPSSWHLTRSQVDKWSIAFPGVDVLAEARMALAWLDAHPTRRKTARGMPAMLVRWLTQEQNKSRGLPSQATASDAFDRAWKNAK